MSECYENNTVFDFIWYHYVCSLQFFINTLKYEVPDAELGIEVKHSASNAIFSTDFSVAWLIWEIVSVKTGQMHESCSISMQSKFAQNAQLLLFLFRDCCNWIFTVWCVKLGLVLIWRINCFMFLDQLMFCVVICLLCFMSFCVNDRGKKPLLEFCINKNTGPDLDWAILCLFLKSESRRSEIMKSSVSALTLCKTCMNSWILPKFLYWFGQIASTCSLFPL